MKRLATLLLTAISLSANGQGFIDLDFETANLSPVPPNHGGPVPIASALPGWSASAGSEPFTEVLQNAIDYGAANVSIPGRIIPQPARNHKPMEPLARLTETTRSSCNRGSEGIPIRAIPPTCPSAKMEQFQSVCSLSSLRLGRDHTQPRL